MLGARAAQWRGLCFGQSRLRMCNPLSVQLTRHATDVIRVEGGAVRSRRARRGKLSQRWDTCWPTGAAGLPQIRADERLGATCERLLDRDYDHRCRLPIVHSETPPQGRINADPGLAADPISLVRTRNQEYQPNARVFHEVLQTVDPIVAPAIGDQQCAAIVLDLNEAGLVALGRAVEPLATCRRQHQKWRGGNESAPHRINVVDLFT
jgi:hypothetical protein